MTQGSLGVVFVEAIFGQPQNLDSPLSWYMLSGHHLAREVPGTSLQILRPGGQNCPKS